MTPLRAYIRANRARALTAAVCVVVIAVCVVQAFVAAGSPGWWKW